jgi:hypothetical protein
MRKPESESWRWLQRHGIAICIMANMAKAGSATSQPPAACGEKQAKRSMAA